MKERSNNCKILTIALILIFKLRFNWRGRHCFSNFLLSNSISRIIVALSISIFYGPIFDPHDNQLPVDLIAQLVEHCTGIAEVRV